MQSYRLSDYEQSSLKSSTDSKFSPQAMLFYGERLFAPAVSQRLNHLASAMNGLVVKR
jgi:hypothetical protein